MLLAANAKDSLLCRARQVAIDIANRSDDKTCHADLVREEMGEAYLELGPAAGSIFKGDCWVFSGRRVLSGLPANHARELKVWKLKEVQNGSLS